MINICLLLNILLKIQISNCSLIHLIGYQPFEQLDPNGQTEAVSTLDLVPIQITLIRIKLVRIGYTLRPHMNRITLVCILSH